MIKKFLLSVFTFIFGLVAPAQVFAATLSLSPSSGTFNKGCTFSLNITLDAGSDQVEGTDVNYLLYDPSRFSATSVSPGSLFSDYPITNIDAASGKIYVSGVDSNNKPFTGTGTFATVNFTVKDAAPGGASQMTFLFNPNDKTNTTDSNVEVIQNNEVADVLSSVINGSYTIGTGTCGAQASSGPSSKGGKGGLTSSGSATVSGYLPPAGSPFLTATLAITGGILTLIGILGLVLL